ncbi:MAG: hypothetical protein IJ484_06955 [Oscillospiraceae bacterium]|nr:hypothetical protein [Oscillospiraceae bacterium]
MKIKLKYVDFMREQNMRDGFEEMIRAGLADLGEVEFCDDPDYIICSTFGREFLHYDCTRIFVCGENLRPDFNLYDYAAGSDWMDYEDRFLSFQWYSFPKWREWAKLALEKHTYPQEVYESKEWFCNFVVSNYGANPIREEMFQALSAYKRVESGGRSCNNQPDGKPVADKLAFQQQCRFSLAFENARTAGYCTEKILDAFAAATVPIYWGDPKVSRLYNPEAFIDCGDCRTVQEMVEKVRVVEEDRDRWLYMLRQPAFTDMEKARREIEGNPFGEFMHHIVAQGPEASRRRSPDFWNAKYEENARQVARLQQQFWWKYYAKGERFLVRKGIWKK